MTAPARDELRELIREVIRDQLAALGVPGAVETVTLATDADLTAFVLRLLDADPAEREALRAGRKRFRLASPSPAGPTGGHSVPIAQSSPLERADCAIEPVPAASGGVRRVDRGAVTERMVRDAARNGERLVLSRAAVLTPLAADRARAAGVQIEKEH